MNLLKTYKWFPAARSENHDPVDPETIGILLDTVGFPDAGGAAPSYKVVLVNKGAQLAELKKTATHQRDIAKSAQVLVFAAFANRDESIDNALTAVGTAMVTASLAGIDSMGIEDFDSGRVDALLGLREQGLRSIALLSLN